mgnify:FL=1
MLQLEEKIQEYEKVLTQAKELEQKLKKIILEYSKMGLITQKEIGYELGCSESFISMVLNNKRYDKRLVMLPIAKTTLRLIIEKKQKLQEENL